VTHPGLFQAVMFFSIPKNPFRDFVIWLSEKEVFNSFLLKGQGPT